MKRLFIILCCLAAIPVNHLLSQESSFLRDNEIVAARRSLNKLSYDMISGTPYYAKNFLNSIVVLPNGDSGTLALRYDMFQDEMEFKKEDKTLWVNKKEVKSIRYGDEKVIVAPLPDDSSKLGFYFIPAEGKYSLLVKKRVEYRPYVPPKPYGEAVPERFARVGDDFYLKAEGTPPRVFRNKKALTGLLADNKAALDFIKNEKIKADDPEDLTKLINFLNGQ